MNLENTNNCGVYMIYSISQPDKYYIGSSKNLHVRKLTHFANLRGNRHKNKKLQNYFNKYGEHDLAFIIMEFCCEDKLIALS